LLHFPDVESFLNYGEVDEKKMSAAEVILLQTVFPDVDEDLLISVLETFNDDVNESIRYLQKHGFKSSEASLKALYGHVKTGMELNTISTGVNILQKSHQGLDSDVIRASIEVRIHNIIYIYIYILFHLPAMMVFRNRIKS